MHSMVRTAFVILLSAVVGFARAAPPAFERECILRPLGPGKDDTSQVRAAIAACGRGGRTTFEPGQYNITSKMTWNLVGSRVDMHGYLNFKPDILYWLNASSTYRVVFIQDQASWFVITGNNFEVNAHNEGGINGNGQPWWSYYANRTREDGDGRPIALTLSNVTHGRISNFHVISPPFWCNAVANSEDVIYDGMNCNATNTDPAGAGRNLVPNTDGKQVAPLLTWTFNMPQSAGIDTYRSNRITLENWDVTCGDDCLAIKGNTTDLLVRNVTCRGGNGIAFGSLGQYVDLPDIVENVVIENVKTIRLDPEVQPNMKSGAYLKTWTGTVNGSPPTGGGGAGGRVSNVTLRDFSLDRVDLPTQLYQTNDGHSQDAPSTLQFSDITWENWQGTSTGAELVSLSCSPAAPCPHMVFQNFNVTPPYNETAKYICTNVVDEQGLSGCS